MSFLAKDKTRRFPRGASKLKKSPKFKDFWLNWSNCLPKLKFSVKFVIEKGCNFKLKLLFTAFSFELIERCLMYCELSALLSYFFSFSISARITSRDCKAGVCSLAWKPSTTLGGQTCLPSWNLFRKSTATWAKWVCSAVVLVLWPTQSVKLVTSSTAKGGCHILFTTTRTSAKSKLIYRCGQ